MARLKVLQRRKVIFVLDYNRRMTGKPISFSDILKSFDSSMQALFDLYLSIQDSMGNKEWGELSEYYNEIFSLFPQYDQDEVQAILDRLIQIDVEDETLDYKKIWEAIKIDPNDILRFENERELFVKDIHDTFREMAIREPETVNKFFRAYLRMQRAGSFRSELSRHGLLLTATSQFELLLLQLLQRYFSGQGIIPNEDSNIDSMEKSISDKIVKTEGRGLKVFDMLDFISKKFTLSNGYSRDVLKEIFERRNVLTHRGGRADAIYRNYNSRVEIGDRLRISQSYIKFALEYLHTWGVLLSMRMWENVDDSDQKQLGRVISEIAMQLIRKGRLDFCVNLLKCVHENIHFASHNTKDILMINYAICLDRMGNEKEKLKILDGVRQTPRQIIPGLKKLSNQEPFSNVIPMAANVLKGNKEYALELLERAVNAGEVTFLDLDHWVIFEYFAKEPSFERIREQLESKVKIA